MACWPNGTKTKPTVTSPYGERDGGWSSWHYGTDFVGFTTVCAILPGRVTAVGVLPGWSAGGIQVVIDHGAGIVTRSLHLERAHVSVGDTVAEAADIGIMGNTGNATGVCVHLEILIGGRNVDPVPWISARIAPTPTPTPAPNINPRDMLGWNWTGIQRMLKGTGRYWGAIDNDPGVGSVTGFQQFLYDKGYDDRAGVGPLARDGDLYTKTVMAAQQWLAEVWGYTGAIDGLPGAGTRAAWNRAEAANAEAFK